MILWSFFYDDSLIYVIQSDSARSPGTLSHAKVYLNASNAGTKKDAHKRYYDSTELADKVFYAYAVTGKFWPELADLGLTYVTRLDLTIVELLGLNWSWFEIFCNLISIAYPSCHIVPSCMQRKKCLLYTGVIVAWLIVFQHVLFILVCGLF